MYNVYIYLHTRDSRTETQKFGYDKLSVSTGEVGGKKGSDQRKWFEDLRKNLEELGVSNVMLDPTRIFNTDETCVQLCSGLESGKNIYEVAAGPEKSNLTFLGTFSARGRWLLVTPMIIYPYVMFGYPKILLAMFQMNFMWEGPTLAR